MKWLSSAGRGEPFHRAPRKTSREITTCRTQPEIESARKESFMSKKQLNPLEKELLIRKFRSNSGVRLTDFCSVNDVSDSAFRKWLKQYESGGLEALARSDKQLGAMFPEGFSRSEESYKREILKLRIENERLKKSYAVQRNAAGEVEYIRLKTKNSK